jgi:hypothetical protein
MACLFMHCLVLLALPRFFNGTHMVKELMDDYEDQYDRAKPRFI